MRLPDPSTVVLLTLVIALQSGATNWFKFGSGDVILLQCFKVLTKTQSIHTKWLLWKDKRPDMEIFCKLSNQNTEYSQKVVAMERQKTRHGNFLKTVNENCEHNSGRTRCQNIRIH